MTSPFSSQQPAPDSDESVLEALLLENINWADSNTGSAVDAILAHFTRLESAK